MRIFRLAAAPSRGETAVASVLDTRIKPGNPRREIMRLVPFMDLRAWSSHSRKRGASGKKKGADFSAPSLSFVFVVTYPLSEDV
jgi:hypothetical protein